MSSLAEDVVVVGLDPAKGKILLGNHATFLVEAAIVIDLVAAGRLTVTGTDHEARVVVIDPTPVPHPVLSEALAWLVGTTRPPTAAELAELETAGWLTRKVAAWVLSRDEPGTKISNALGGFYAWRRTVDHLVATGVLQVRDHRGWTLRSSPRYTATPSARRDELVGHLRGVLVDGLEPDPRARRLLGLLGATTIFSHTTSGAAHLARWTPRPRRKEVMGRTQQLLVTEDVADVRAAIDAAHAVIDERARKAASSGG